MIHKYYFPHIDLDKNVNINIKYHIAYSSDQLYVNYIALLINNKTIIFEKEYKEEPIAYVELDTIIDDNCSIEQLVTNYFEIIEYRDNCLLCKYITS